MTFASRGTGAIALMAMAALACNLPLFAPSTPPAEATLGRLYTQAAQTLQASQAQIGTPTGTATPTVAPPTFATPSSTRAPGAGPLCNAAAFVRDVSIPDGTTVQPGADFTKTWRLSNVGTCTWTTAYALVFVTGDRMHGAQSVGLP
ncbi:MAG TPA: NBR1-Ig-like domain-containing protein, partial [Anaerolineales bacterium]|nr:NBR1-Ig-like domain-containing protein [Anaerolineales bacterium]